MNEACNQSSIDCHGSRPLLVALVAAAASAACVGPEDDFAVDVAEVAVEEAVSAASDCPHGALCLYDDAFWGAAGGRRLQVSRCGPLELPYPDFVVRSWHNNQRPDTAADLYTRSGILLVRAEAGTSGSGGPAERTEVIVNCAGPADDEHADEQPSAPRVVAPLAAACPLAYFPVRGRHETGYQANPSSGDRGIWSCDGAYSNSDYYTRPSCGGHLGNDIWAAEGTPVVATVSGTIVQAEFSSYSGNQVRIMDDCGWSHYAIHLQAIASGISVGSRIEAGALIGWVGKTGATNGVVHLHYSIYPGEDYCSGVDPWPYLNAVERNVCDGAPPDRCSVHDDGRLWCDNRSPASVRARTSPSAAQVDVLRTTYSWFSCFAFGERHHGGNNTWYRTIGDDSGRWGWVAAGDVQTTSDFDADPAAHGLQPCASDRLDGASR